nr:LysR substrate-binding domain-containing protein [Amylibacter sp.]
MTVRIPSTQAMRALESFARLGSVWRAAEDLNITRSAVSHQLRQLERDLGFSLYNRVGTRLELTPQGATYAADIRRALSTIAGAAMRNAGRGVSGSLTVSCTPGFASSWLCPKIGSFHKACPDVELRVVTPRRLDDVSTPEVDLFIAFGGRNLPDMQVELLQEVEFTPLCSPALMNRLNLSEPGDALRAGLMHLSAYEDWEAWFRLAGLPEAQARQGVVFCDMNMVYSACLASQGIAMGDAFICHDSITSGQLVRPFDLSIRSPRSYFLVIPGESPPSPVVAAFRDWLMDQMPDPHARPHIQPMAN